MRVLLPRGRRVLPNGLRGERAQGLLQDPKDRPGTEAAQVSSSSSSSSSSLSFASSSAGTVPCLRTKKAVPRNRQHAKKALSRHLSLELEDLYLLICCVLNWKIDINSFSAGSFILFLRGVREFAVYSARSIVLCAPTEAERNIFVTHLVCGNNRG